jgi:hypothetical protein
MRLLLIFFLPIIYQRKNEILNQLKNPNITEYDKLIIIRKNKDLIEYVRRHS